MNRVLFILIYCLLILPLSWLIPEILLSALVLATGIPHVILGAKYSRRGIGNSWIIPWQKFFLLLLFPLSVWLGLKAPLVGLVVYFGIHHGISETYSNKENKSNGSLFTIGHFILVTGAYFFACRNNMPDIPFFSEVLLTLWSVSLILIIFLKRKSLLTKQFLIEYPWLLGAMIMLMLSFIKPFPWQVLILFHFTFWGVLPVFRKAMFERGSKQLKIFWKDAWQWNGSWLVVIGALVSWSYINKDYRLFELLLVGFYMATYWHITASFVISGSNPTWLRRIFSPRRNQAI